MTTSRIKRQLYIGLAVLTLITAFSCSVGVYLFVHQSEAITTISQERFPELQQLNAAAQLAQKITQITDQTLANATSSAQAASLTEQLDQYWSKIAQALSPLVDEQAIHTNNPTISEVLHQIQRQRSNLPALTESNKSQAKENTQRIDAYKRLHTHLDGYNQLFQASLLYLADNKSSPQEARRYIRRLHQLDILMHQLEPLLKQSELHPTLLSDPVQQTRIFSQLSEMQTLSNAETPSLLPHKWLEQLVSSIQAPDGLLALTVVAHLTEKHRLELIETHNKLASELLILSSVWSNTLQQSIQKTAQSISESSSLYIYLLIIASIGFILLIMLIIWIYVGNSILSPLISTSKAMLQIANGQVSTPLPPHRNDEIGDMIHALKKLKVYVAQVKTLSQKDGLTGLYNRRLLDETLIRELKRANRENLPLSLLLCDIDFFKAFNDNYGHLKGDACLQQVSQLMQQHFMRAYDLCARYGGEEFAVVLPATNADTAFALSESFRLAVENLQIPHQFSNPFSVITLSIGVTTLYPSRDYSPEQLIAKADKALYQAKHSGRNCVIEG